MWAAFAYIADTRAGTAGTFNIGVTVQDQAGSGAAIAAIAAAMKDALARNGIRFPATKVRELAAQCYAKLGGAKSGQVSCSTAGTVTPEVITFRLDFNRG
jgi:hypothetical protein